MTTDLGMPVVLKADVAQYDAKPHGNYGRANVTLVNMTSFPVRTLAAAAGLYSGDVWRDPRSVSRHTALRWLSEMSKTVLETPLEFIDMHFLIEGCSRAFTHQLVRQRTAAFVQESQRFAVKRDAEVAVYRPPSIDDLPIDSPAALRWANLVAHIGAEYNAMVDEGIPAEDARGILPTNILTRVHYKTNLRNFLQTMGKRLCTQAQFEWRGIVNQMAYKIGNFAAYHNDVGSEWEFRAIAELVKPICYQTGKCEFMAESDRHCEIRNRVNNFHDMHIRSQEWSNEIRWGRLAIKDQEWALDPAAARHSPDPAGSAG